MYTSPGAYCTTDYLCRVEHRYVDACKDECIFKDNISFTSDADVNDLCVIIMQERGWSKAQSANSGRELYRRLREEMIRLII